jgi:rhomboid protease GluP
VEEDEKADRNMHPMHREKWGALVISKSYVVTPLIVYANALVFLAMVVSGISPLEPTAKSLFAWGGNFRLAVTDGQWWRLISYQFLHGGAMHLIMNTFALLFIGMYLEPLMGRLRFSAAYVLTGICAGLLSIVMHNNSVGVGASGAIFGLYGVFLSMLTTNHIQKSVRRTMLRSILFFVVYNLIAGLQGNTDNAAHIGGLLSGVLIGYAFFPGISKKANTPKQLATIALLTMATSLLTATCVYLLR